MGENYIEVANDVIKSEIEKQGENSAFWSKEEGGFSSISDKTAFYVNEGGNPVIVFEKYELQLGLWVDLNLKLLNNKKINKI